MPLRIELETLWRRLMVRFKARRKTDTDPDDPDHPILLETLQPITNFDELARSIEIGIVGTFARTAVAGAGTVDCLVIPDGERWHIRALRLVSTLGDGTLDDLFVLGRTGIDMIRIFTQGAATILATDLLNPPVILEEGQRLRVAVDAITADSAWDVRAYYDKEDAF